MNYPNFDYEMVLWRRGVNIVAGLDEVGRGAFAGPVVTGCVVFPPNFHFTKSSVLINDSKKLTSKQRNLADKWIKTNALYWSVGESGVALINKLGVGKATNSAFRKAVYKINKVANIEHLLIDAFFIPKISGLAVKNSQTALIKGDSKSISIAAASILAKVYRDNLMQTLGSKIKAYDWIQNKGYGTKKHRMAILKHGITRHHRTSFVNSWHAKLNTDI